MLLSIVLLIFIMNVRALGRQYLVLFTHNRFVFKKWGDENRISPEIW